MAFFAVVLLASWFSWAKGMGIQVIGTGVSRTSTQSLSLALTQLGFKTLHAEGFHPKIPLWKEAPELVDLVTKSALESLERQDFQVLLPALEKIEQLNVTALVDAQTQNLARNRVSMIFHLGPLRENLGF
ncbi:unnamed protein product [Effrenium voratum]|nr:unnamed protein product [Effrenium voratum]